jgi:hypothetical protein
MNLNTYTRPTIRIGDIETNSYDSFTITQPGDNQINSCSIKGLPRDLTTYSLNNQEVVIFLNEGSNDSRAAFRGYVKKTKLGGETVTVTAYDPRILLSGKDAFPIVIDDNENFDGHTLVQFVHNYIKTQVNKNSTLIGIDLLKETDPKLLMRGFRTELAVPYQVMQDSLSQAIRDSDIENPIDYEFIMIDDGLKSNIVLQEKRLLTEPASMSFDFLDGILSMNYEKSPVPNFALVKGNNIQSKFQFGNMPEGPSGITVSGPYDDRDTAKTAGIIEVMRAQDEFKNISITCNKGYDVDIGSIINIYSNQNITDDSDISGNHRVTSKTITFSKNSCQMQLTLNRRPMKLSQYIF